MIGELEFFGGKGRASGAGLQVQSLGCGSILNALISDGKTMHFRTFVENIFWMQSVRVAEPEGEPRPWYRPETFNDLIVDE